MTQNVKALCIDGGGIRGLIPLVSLAYLEQKTGKPCNQLFNYIGGTSTGGIIALGLAAGLPATTLTALYVQQGAKIFSSSWWYKLTNLGNFAGPKYPASGIESVLKVQFNNQTTKDLKTNAMVVSYNISNHTVKLFNSWEDQTYYIRDLCRATTAAPTYFPPANIGNTNGTDKSWYIDGGLVANNPSMCLVTEICKREQTIPANISMLSLGTGLNEGSIDGTVASKWGELPWASNVIDVGMNGTQDLADTQASLVLSRYVRVQPPNGLASQSMDDVSTGSLKTLQDIGTRMVALCGDSMLALVNS